MSSAQSDIRKLASCLHVRQLSDIWLYEANAPTEMERKRN